MLTLTSWLIVAMMTWSCASSSQQVDRSDLKTTVRVENQNFLDMTVYVLRLSQRLRLGTVPGLSTRVLVIPEHIISGAASVRLLADPLGSNKTPISREFSVTPGDQIEMIISN